MQGEEYKAQKALRAAQREEEKLLREQELQSRADAGRYHDEEVEVEYSLDEEEEAAKEAVFGLDVDERSEALKQAGPEKWKQMKWKERLSFCQNRPPPEKDEAEDLMTVLKDNAAEGECLPAEDPGTLDLLKATKKGEVELVKKALAEGVGDINGTDKLGFNALALACLKGRTEVFHPIQLTCPDVPCIHRMAGQGQVSKLGYDLHLETRYDSYREMHAKYTRAIYMLGGNCVGRSRGQPASGAKARDSACDLHPL